MSRLRIQPGARRHPRLQVAVVGLLCALAGLFAGAAGGPRDSSRAAAEESGAQPVRPGPPGKPAADTLAEQEGERLFDQAGAWINYGKPGVEEIRTFKAHLHDVQWKRDEEHQDGYLRVWFRAPGEYRQEWRRGVELGPNASSTTKILAGQRLWIVTSGGKTRRIHGTAGGAAAVAQLQRDRDRMADLARFATLSGLKAPGVVFTYLGLHTGTGPLKGRHLLVRRRTPQGGLMDFYLAYEADADGRPIRATYPAAVELKGSAAARERSEVYRFSRWRKGARFRFAGRIEAFGKDSRKPEAPYGDSFLLAFPEQIEVNTELDGALFRPPQAAPGGAPARSAGGR